jgi:cullin-4
MSSKRKQGDKSIRDHFSAEPSSSPSNKRAKLDARGANQVAPTPAAPSSKMYHFPSKKEVVDLTASPPSAVKNGIRTAPDMHANGGPKRMLVKNFKVARKVDPKAFLDQTWQKVAVALDTVFARGNIDFSLEELYRGIENLCRQGMAKETLSKLKAKCKAHVSGTLKGKITETAGRKDVDVLRATLQAWAAWMEQMVGARHLVFCGGRTTADKVLEIYRLDLLLPRPLVSASETHDIARNSHITVPRTHFR